MVVFYFRKLIIFTMAFCSLAIVGCEDSEFSGANAQCTPDGDTNVSLDTDSVSNGQSGNAIYYNITLKNICSAQLEEISAIHFDINGELSSENATIPVEYEIYKDGETFIKGYLVSVDGEDLFGNVGESYFHSKTDKEISYKIAKKGVTLKISLGGALYMPPGSSGSYNGDNITLDTFLKFGTSALITQPVSFVDGYSYP
jgi:hypothetical protein